MAKLSELMVELGLNPDGFAKGLRAMADKPPMPPSIPDYVVRAPTLSPIHLDHDDEPLPSPHPAFGKKPGWWARTFGSDEDAYWPTHGDARCYREYMEQIREKPIPDAPLVNPGCPPRRPLPSYDPELSGWMHSPGLQWEHRRRVYRLMQELRRRANPPRSWWENLP